MESLCRDCDWEQVSCLSKFGTLATSEHPVKCDYEGLMGDVHIHQTNMPRARRATTNTTTSCSSTSR